MVATFETGRRFCSGNDLTLDQALGQARQYLQQPGIIDVSIAKVEDFQAQIVVREHTLPR